MGHASLQAGIVMTKSPSHSWLDDPRVQQIQGAHPIPDERSLLAGESLLAFIARLPPDARVVFLLSGGASALVEVLPASMRLADWQAIHRAWLASGWDIARINAERKRLSCIKGGKLLDFFPRSCDIVQLVISDVQHNDLATIGSGLLVAQSGHDHRVRSHILSDHRALLMALSTRLPEARISPTFVTEEVTDLVDQIVEVVQTSHGVTVWGGEPVVRLPETVGMGGRMQHLALMLVWRLRHHDRPWRLLAIGSDGSDGMSQAAGADVSHQTLALAQARGWDVNAYLQNYDSGTLLAEMGALITLGDTGTNVNDVMLLWCE